MHKAFFPSELVCHLPKQDFVTMTVGLQSISSANTDERREIAFQPDNVIRKPNDHFFLCNVVEEDHATGGRLSTWKF